MKYIDIRSSQSVQKLFEKEELLSLYAETTEGKLMIRCGYKFIEGKFLIEIIGIRLENTTTYEMFQVFEMENLIVNDYYGIKPLVISRADSVEKYDKDICQYYKTSLNN